MHHIPSHGIDLAMKATMCKSDKLYQDPPIEVEHQLLLKRMSFHRETFLVIVESSVTGDERNLQNPCHPIINDR